MQPVDLKAFVAESERRGEEVVVILKNLVTKEEIQVIMSPESLASIMQTGFKEG